MIVLASAFLRLRLYQDVYGWTELRFYVMAAIVWLAIGAAGALTCVALDPTRRLPHGLVMLSVIFGLAFNVIGPVRFIAEQNVVRVTDTELPPEAFDGLDLLYLARLGDDALAVIAEHYPDDMPRSAVDDALRALRLRAEELRLDPAADDWQAWTLSRERVRGLLSQDGLLR
jgi:hypothetical protein